MTTALWCRVALTGLYLLIFLLPWQTRWIISSVTLDGRPWDYGQISLYATQIILFAVVTVTLLGKPDYRNLRRWWPAWVLEFWAIIAMIWSSHQSVALYHASLIVSAVLLGECILLLKPNPRRIATVILGTGLIQGLLAISQFMGQHVIGSKWLGLAEHWAVPGHSLLQTAGGLVLRAYGSLPHPNILGVWLAVAWICGLLLYIPLKKTAPLAYRLALNFGLLIILFGLLLSFSRGAWLAVAIGTIWILVVTAKKINWRVAVIAGATILGTVILLAIPFRANIYGRTALESGGGLEGLSISDRRQSIINGGQLFIHSPLIGYGVTPIVQPPHLVPLAIVDDLGIIGLAIVCLLIFMMRPRRWWDWYSPLLAVPLITGLFDHYWWTLWAGLSLGVIVLVLPRLADDLRQQ